MAELLRGLRRRCNGAGGRVVARVLGFRRSRPLVDPGQNVSIRPLYDRNHAPPRHTVCPHHWPTRRCVVKIAVVHNLPPGGARRRLVNHVEHLDGEVVEICLETAAPVTAAARVIPFRPYAPRTRKVLRPPLRYLDLAGLERAWRIAGREVASVSADVVYLNPCRYLNGPPILRDGVPRAVYFCDEPRRIDAEPQLRSTRSALTYGPYAPMYARQRRLDRRAATRAWALATNSRYTASQIERVYGRRATVVRMGVAEALLDAARASAPSPATGRYLLSVGALIPTKGHDLALSAAAASASRMPLHVVAPRPAAEEERRLRALARRVGIRLSIHIGISDSQLAAEYAGALATLYLAEREPLGLVSLEAQACGCPVIVAAEGGLPETIVDGVTGWQVPRDPAAAAAAIDRLDAEDSLRWQASEAAAAHARGWTWTTSAAEIQALLDGAVASEASR